jgi:hypothetical protein
VDGVDMEKFRKRLVVIETVQWTGSNLNEIEDMIQDKDAASVFKFENGKLVIFTLEGQHLANIGDWIIKGVRGEFYPCKPDIFEMTYERVSE